MSKHRSLAADFPALALQWHPTLNDRTPEQVQPGTNDFAWWQCPSDERHVWRAAVGSRALGGVGCPVCANRLILPGVNDLASLYPELAAQWHTRNQTLPHEVSPGSNKRYWWQCPANPQHEWEARVKNRAKMGVGCPFCSNRRVAPGGNSLAVAYPHLVAEWDTVSNEKRPDEVSVSSGYRAHWVCEPRGHTWEAFVYNRTLGQTGCPFCQADSYVSRFETEVADFVEGAVGEGLVVRSDRAALKGAELDIFVPSLALAIEVHGIFWHSEAGGKSRTAHRDKYERARDAGIRLIQVWEDDWRDRRTAAEHMLLSKLGADARPRVNARQTEPAEVPRSEAAAFLEENHIQGFASGSRYLGLRQGEELVAVMVLQRSGKARELKLNRYASSALVRGGQSKLLRYAERVVPGWDSIITFADLEVSSGGLYESTGWKKEAEIAPDYMYVWKRRRHHKFGFRKARFRSDPELIFVEGRSERQLAAMNGLSRAWDSGKIRYRYFRRQG